MESLLTYMLENAQLVFSDDERTVTLPRTTNDKYECYPEEIGSRLEMISGRMVWETRGHVQKIHYQYDCMGNTLWREIASFLRSSKAINVQYLPDDSDEMMIGQFVCESLTSPKFAFIGENGERYWHNIEFTLREVSPHD